MEGACALRWKGNVTTKYQWGYAGIGLGVSSVSFGKAKKVVLMTRGDGKSVRLKLPMGQQEKNKEYNNYGAPFACGDGSGNWKKVEISFDQLQQEQGWGAARPLDLGDIALLQFQTMGQPLSSYQCDLGQVSLY